MIDFPFKKDYRNLMLQKEFDSMNLHIYYGIFSLIIVHKPPIVS